MFDEVLELLKDTLKGAFSRDTERKRTRKIIFWYDSKQEYEDFINELELDNTEIIKYDNNSFWIRYHIEKEELNKNKKALEIASKKSNELDKTTNDIKDTINNLKKAPIVKNTYTISESDKNKIIEYVDKVEDTNKDFKKTEMLSITLNNVDTELQENREKIKILTENNKALSLKVDTLSKNIDNKNKEIKELKSDNKHLEEMVDYFKNLFSRLVKFIKNKMFGKEKEREDYWKVSKDMHEHGIFSDVTIESIKDDYVWNKENDKHKDKGRDDFEL